MVPEQRIFGLRDNANPCTCARKSSLQLHHIRNALHAYLTLRLRAFLRLRAEPRIRPRVGPVAKGWPSDAQAAQPVAQTPINERRQDVL